MATIPGREAIVGEALRSLRPQVETIRVICHDMTAPPPLVRDLADEYRCEPDTEGAAAKFRWAQAWSGLYFAVDDDFRYPPDYAATMARWVRRWRGRALVTACGRLLPPYATRFQDAKRAFAPRSRCPGGWINYGCSGVLAFDSTLRVPTTFPARNADEAGLAVWAQAHRVPFWLVPHESGWLQYLIEDKAAPTIWNAAKRDGFTARNAVLQSWPRANRPWRVFKMSGVRS